MKKVFKSILLLIALCLPLLGQRVNADVTEEPLQVVVQHQFENPDGSELVYGADIALSLYDISKQYQAQETPTDAQEFIESFSQLSAQQLRQYLADNEIKKVETVTTDVMGKAHFKVAGNDNAYLIVQDHAVKGQTILPLAFSLPLQNEDGTPKNMVELYTKPIKLTSCAYFYKYGVNGDKQVALADAQFILGQEVAGKKQYLATDETSFVASDDPANDAQVKKFTSDEQGLVLHDSELAPGQYFFSEVKAPNGYSISEAAKQIEVTVAADMQITVAGVQLVELVAGMVPSSFTTAPKVLNYAISEDKPEQTPTVPTDNGNNNNPSFDNGGTKGSSVGGMLAQLGEKKGLVSLIGILLVSFAVVEFIRQRKERSGKHEE